MPALTDEPQNDPDAAPTLPELPADRYSNRELSWLDFNARVLTLALDDALGSSTAIHLSGTMCAAHRADKLAEIRALLVGGGPCRVVSTQLVEAGVDLDFPVVYRAVAGLDSLVQAAGRANREGRLGERGGLLRIYRATSRPPAGLPRKGADAAAAMFRSAEMDGKALALFGHAAAQAFFHRYYQSIDDKDRGITPMRAEFRFGDVDKAYRFIDDTGATLIVPYNKEAADAAREARTAAFPRAALRRLQRFSVTVYPQQLRALLDSGAAEPLMPGSEPGSCALFLLTRTALYDVRFGLEVSRAGSFSPNETIM